MSYLKTLYKIKIKKVMEEMRILKHKDRESNIILSILDGSGDNDTNSEREILSLSRNLSNSLVLQGVDKVVHKDSSGWMDISRAILWEKYKQLNEVRYIEYRLKSRTGMPPSEADLSTLSYNLLASMATDHKDIEKIRSAMKLAFPYSNRPEIINKKITWIKGESINWLPHFALHLSQNEVGENIAYNNTICAGRDELMPILYHWNNNDKLYQSIKSWMQYREGKIKKSWTEPDRFCYGYSWVYSLLPFELWAIRNKLKLEGRFLPKTDFAIYNLDEVPEDLSFDKDPIMISSLNKFKHLFNEWKME